MDELEMIEQVEVVPFEGHAIHNSDRYGPGARLLRRWSLNDEGMPVCAEDALDTLAASAEQIAEAEAANAAVRVALDVPVLGRAPLPMMADYQAAITAHVNATAAQRGYESAVSCASYIASTIPIYAAEAAAFVPWRDAVWVAVTAALAAVQQGAPPPTIAGLIESLPAIQWPPSATA